MSLVTLIKSADTTLRDAVVQIEEWFLPKEAVATGKVDEAGRAVFTLLKAEVAEVEADIQKEEPVVKNVLNEIEDELKSVANTAESEIETLIQDVEAEAKKVTAKVTGFFRKANT